MKNYLTNKLLRLRFNSIEYPVLAEKCDKDRLDKMVKLILETALSQRVNQEKLVSIFMPPSRSVMS